MTQIYNMNVNMFLPRNTLHLNRQDNFSPNLKLVEKNTHSVLPLSQAPKKHLILKQNFFDRALAAEQTFSPRRKPASFQGFEKQDDCKTFYTAKYIGTYFGGAVLTGTALGAWYGRGVSIRGGMVMGAALGALWGASTVFLPQSYGRKAGVKACIAG